MRIFSVIVIAVSISALCPPTALAEDFAGAGAGAATCAQFAKAYAAAPQVTGDLYYSWALGFMTGLNTENPDPLFAVLNAMSPHDQMSAFRDYCDAHPLEKYIDAVINLYLSMPKKPLPASNPTQNSN